MVDDVGDYGELADDYADLIAAVMEGISTEEILKEVDALLNSEDVKGWHAFLSRMWRATENIS